ncbi:hydroxymethylglutaryl-CoA lyase [Flavobacteriaceae bacterium]|nr:hydroxymethylglutaryl-CoA lyase [Flavobacteriaceae bacterium]
MQKLKIIECPRDAMQGIKNFIPTVNKISYIQSLLKVGFDTVDCGSFVSPKAVPQMSDTAAVIAGLDCSMTTSKLLVIVANQRGAVEACQFDKIDYLGYPFSISENFQMRNTHKTIEQSLVVLKDIIAIAKAHHKSVVVYLSMGFGNPYGDPWSVDIVQKWVDNLIALNVSTISLSDTVGSANPKDIKNLFFSLIKQFSKVEFGAHFHTHPNTWYDKINAAYISGCRRFDSSIKGWGGCPMAQDALVGNMPTEKLISYFLAQKNDVDISILNFETAYNKSHSIFYD